MLKVKCFTSQNFGHYASNFLEIKMKERENTSITNIENDDDEQPS